MLLILKHIACVYVYLMILMNKVCLRGYHDENVDDDEMNKIAQ